MNLRKAVATTLLFFALASIEVKAQFVELETQFEDGRYSFTFSEGFFLVALAVDQGSGSIFFNVPDATEIEVPDDWVITHSDTGFAVAYDGVFDVYPLGFEEVEISFSSGLSISELGDSEDNFAGSISGPAVLKNGFAPGFVTNGSSSSGPPIGIQGFYYDMPAYDGPQLLIQGLIDIFGFSPDEIRPIPADIQVGSDDIAISLENVIRGATYILQFKENLEDETWINLKTFTYQDLDESNRIHCDKESLSGFFQISII